MTKKSPKVAKKYLCEKCDYSCCKISDFNKHNLTRKHKMMTMSDTKVAKVAPSINFQCECGRLYKYRQGLHNHRKKCSTILEEVCVVSEKGDENESTYKNIIVQLLNDNKEMRELLKEQQIDHHNEVKELLPKLGNVTNHNQQVNVNVFLNEQCKNAINLTDFIHKLPIDFSDLNAIAEKGFVEGISQTLLEGLKRLSIYERPIHCTDTKRETLYIKENNTWEKDDNGHVHMKNAIQKLKRRNMTQIGDIINAQDISNSIDISTKIIHSHVEGMNDGQEKSMSKIIKNITKGVLIEKM